MTTTTQNPIWIDHRWPFETSAAAASGAATLDAPLVRETVSRQAFNVTADEWFAGGGRVPYDRRTKEILRSDDAAERRDVVQVFRRIVKDAVTDEDAVWTSFLPGWPDGSFGWAKVDQHLTGKGSGRSSSWNISGTAIPTNPSIMPMARESEQTSSKHFGRLKESSRRSSSVLTTHPSLPLNS